MKRHYISLWLLLLCAFAVFAVASALDIPEIAGYTLKSSGIADVLTAHRDKGAISLDTVAPDSADSSAREEFPAPLDTAAQTILLIGDSMLDGIGPRLAAYADHNGHTLYSVIWYSST